MRARKVLSELGRTETGVLLFVVDTNVIEVGIVKPNAPIWVKRYNPKR